MAARNDDLAEDQDLLAEGEEEEKKFQYLDQAMLDSIEDVFEIFDKQKEGFIKDSDLGTVLRALNFNPTEAELTSMIKEVDQGGTGIELETLQKLVD